MIDHYCALTNAKVTVKDCFDCHFEAVKLMLKNAEGNISAIDGLVEIVWRRAFHCSALRKQATKLFFLERERSIGTT